MTNHHIPNDPLENIGAVPEANLGQLPPNENATCSNQFLRVYRLSHEGPPIEPAERDRRWMDETVAKFANRCLPMRIANEAGWFIRNTRQVDFLWNGGPSIADISISFGPTAFDPSHAPVVSHFGHGIVTWKIPYLIRTPEGCNLYVRGPSNHCKDGICPLDGIVESDWSVSTFTMNWKITRINSSITFGIGEPICMIFPVPRGYLETFKPEVHDLEDDPQLLQHHLTWSETRAEQLRATRDDPSSSSQVQYAKGRSPSTSSFAHHQTRITLQPFK